MTDDELAASLLKPSPDVGTIGLAALLTGRGDYTPTVDETKVRILIALDKYNKALKKLGLSGGDVMTLREDADALADFDTGRITEQTDQLTDYVPGGEFFGLLVKIQNDMEIVKQEVAAEPLAVQAYQDFDLAMHRAIDKQSQLSFPMLAGAEIGKLSTHIGKAAKGLKEKITGIPADGSTENFPRLFGIPVWAIGILAILLGSVTYLIFKRKG